MGFTKEELEEMRRADEEIERDFALTLEDFRRGTELDRAFRREAMTPGKQKALARWRAYREANREKEAERQRAYYEANREKLAAYQRAYYEANREEVAEYQRAYREARRRAKRESVETATLGA